MVWVRLVGGWSWVVLGWGWLGGWVGLGKGYRSRLLLLCILQKTLTATKATAYFERKSGSHTDGTVCVVFACLEWRLFIGPSVSTCSFRHVFVVHTPSPFLPRPIYFLRGLLWGTHTHTHRQNPSHAIRTPHGAHAWWCNA